MKLPHAIVFSILGIVAAVAFVSSAVAGVTKTRTIGAPNSLTVLNGQAPLDSLPRGGWSPDFLPPSTDTTVNAMIVADSQLVVAGEFNGVGVCGQAHGIASWD